MREYTDYIKTETDENGVLWYWIEEPLFTPSDFLQDIEVNYKSRLEFRTKNDATKETEFIKEEFESLQQMGNQKPETDPFKFSFAGKYSGGWFSDEEIEEYKRYFAEYSDYKYLTFYKDFLTKRLARVQSQDEKELVKETKPSKPKKIAEKWHALHYWLELMAHGKKPHLDIDGGFIKSELEQEGKNRCKSTGQSFYREFKEIDINNPISLKGAFGKDWKNRILEMCENDPTTTDFISLKYR